LKTRDNNTNFTISTNVPVSIETGPLSFSIYWARTINGQEETLLTLNAKHSVYEIEYAVKKDLTIRIGSNTYIIKEGQFVIIPPEITHQIIDSDPNGIKFICGFKPGERSLIYFKNTFSASEIITASNTVNDIYNTICSIPDPSVKKNDNIMLNSLLFSLIISFFDSASPEGIYKEESGLSENEIRMQSFFEEVNKRNGVGITVSEAAALVNLSERQLFRICTSTIGRTPSEVINERKLRFLIHCLIYTPLNLSEIADLCGFQTEYAMAKFFRRYEDLNPSEYRKTHRNTKNII